MTEETGEQMFKVVLPCESRCKTGSFYKILSACEELLSLVFQGLYIYTQQKEVVYSWISNRKWKTAVPGTPSGKQCKVSSKTF